MIIVTGGAGFIGSALVWKLNQMGRTDIIIIDNLATDDKYKNLVPLKFMDYIHKHDFGHLVNEGFLKDSTIDTVFHLGACSSTTMLDVNYLMVNNYDYTKYLCEQCLDNNIRFIYASSAATYGDGANGYEDDETKLETLRPLNAYGYSKHLFDLYAKRNGYFNSIAGIKYFNV